MKPDLKAMCNGAIQEKFENSFGRVMENMQDVNTPYKDNGGILCAIFEADGGAWKIEAMQNIKSYLCEQLEDKPQFTIIA